MIPKDDIDASNCFHWYAVLAGVATFTFYGDKPDSGKRILG